MSNRFRAYSRANPSPQYTQLIEYYQSMHSDGYRQKRQGEWVLKPSDQAFPGKKTIDFASGINDLIKRNGAKSVLDYGSGKGGHYAVPIKVKEKGQKYEYSSLMEYWGVDYVSTWEPGSGEELPAEKHDAVITTDVIEHIYYADIFWVIDELFPWRRSVCS